MVEELPRRVLFVRHGQGAHNASIKNWKLIDPPLNEVGLAQAAKLCETLKAGEIKPREFDVVCVSPLTRAMQTAKGGFKGTKVPFHVTPLLRELILRLAVLEETPEGEDFRASLTPLLRLELSFLPVEPLSLPAPRHAGLPL